MFSSRFESLSDLRKAFPTEQSCIDYLEERRWHGNVVSPFDKTSKVYKCKDNKYRCKTQENTSMLRLKLFSKVHESLF